MAESRRKWLHLDTNSTNTFHYATGTTHARCFVIACLLVTGSVKQATHKAGTITARPQHPSCQYRDDRPVYAHRGQPGLCASKHRFLECIRLDDPTLPALTGKAERPAIPANSASGQKIDPFIAACVSFSHVAQAPGGFRVQIQRLAHSLHRFRFPVQRFGTGTAICRIWKNRGRQHCFLVEERQLPEDKSAHPVCDQSYSRRLATPARLCAGA